MADYSVDIQAKLSGFEKVYQLEQQLNALKNNTVKINVELNGNGSNLAKLLESQMSSMRTTAKKTGLTIGRNLGQGIKSVKFNKKDSTFFGDYFQNLRDTQKDAQRLKKIYSTYKVTNAEALRAVKTNQKHIDQIEAAREKTILKRNQAEKNLVLQQSKAQNKALEDQYKQLSMYSKKFELGDYKAQQAKMQSQLQKYAGVDSQALASAKQFASEYGKIQSTLSKHFDGIKTLNKDDLISYFAKAEEVTKKFNNEMKVLSSTVEKPFNALNAATASNKTLTYLNNNTKAMKKYGQAFRELAALQKNATSDKELAEYNVKYRNLVSTVQSEGLTGRSFTAELKRGFSQIGQFVGTYAIFQKSIQTLKQMWKAVLDVDTAITELRKVSDASDLQLDTYFNEATESAKKYGATISDVISSAADWSRLGYSLEDSKKLSDITTLYQRVGDNMTQEKASESLVSTLQGFKLGAEEAEHIVNAFNEVGNNFAIGSDGIGEALQRSASSMMAAGNTLEQTIGLVTAANEVVQDPARVGNGFKTKFCRNCLYVQKCA